MIPIEKIKGILKRYADLGQLLNTVDGQKNPALGKEYHSLHDVAEIAKDYMRVHSEVGVAESWMNDPEMELLAAEELPQLRAELTDLEGKMKLALLPKDIDAKKSAIIEIRAGTGGDEAALFAGDLLKLYRQYAFRNDWKFSELSMSPSTSGGYKEVLAAIKGAGVFARLRFEAGVHRVQRVPATEASGRIHTSAATVAVLPEPDEVEIKISKDDIRIDTMRASGAGGQHVNKTDSAVRITHLKSGIVVTSSEKSQHRNRAAAMNLLRARLYELQRSEAVDSRAEARKSQVGSGDRSERIRTYNFPEQRVTDHRVNMTLYNLEQFLNGDIDKVVDALIEFDQARRLAGPEA